MSLKDIEAINKEFLLAEDIAPFLGMSPQSIRNQAQDAPHKLGFPAIVCGSQVRFPKLGFVDFIKHGRRA